MDPGLATVSLHGDCVVPSLLPQRCLSKSFARRSLEKWDGKEKIRVAELETICRFARSRVRKYVWTHPGLATVSLHGDCVVLPLLTLL